MSSNKTVVKGIRASQEFFDKCDLVAKAEGVDRNKLIVRVVSEYCDNSIDRFENGGLPKSGKLIIMHGNDKEVRECKCGAKFSAYINDKNDIYCNKCKHKKEN